MNRKKFAKLNLEDDDTLSFEDEDVGPLKPGNSFFKWLGKGPPLKVPIAETIFVGPPGTTNQVKILYNDSKGIIQQQIGQFDQQTLKDQFMEMCVERFVNKSNPLAAPPLSPEPIYNRIVAIQKRAATGGKPLRGYMNQTCDLLLPISLHAHLLDITEGSSSSGFIIQKFIKSRGKRPSVYRLFWKTASMETGAVEGWNITKTSDEFQVPDIVLDPTQKKVNEETLSGQALEEYQSKQQTSKLIASFLLAGQQYLEFVEPVPNTAAAPKQQPPPPQYQQTTAAKSHSSFIHINPNNLTSTESSGAMNTNITNNPWAVGKVGRSSMIAVRKNSNPGAAIAAAAARAVQNVNTATSYTMTNTNTNTNTNHSLPVIAAINTNTPHDHDSNKRRVSLNVPSDSPMSPLGRAEINNNKKAGKGDGTGYRSSKKRNIFDHTTAELDAYFVKGLEKRPHLIGIERSDAIMVSSKMSYQLIDQVTASITSHDGLISDEKCAKLMITRISNSALTTPIQYIADIVHWIETMLQVNHQLFLQVNECVCDFIKDDHGKWSFINLKSFKINGESHARARLWHQITTNPSGAAALQARLHPRLTSQERQLKHEAELGINCKLCGLYYIEHSTIDVTKDQSKIGEEKKDGVVITVVPSYGYTMTRPAAAIVAGIYQSYKLPLTRFAFYLLNNYSSHQDIQFRSVRQSFEAEGKNGSSGGGGGGGGAGGGKGGGGSGSGGTADIVICCYHCCIIYERHLLLNRRSEKLYSLLGIHSQQEKDTSFDAIFNQSNNANPPLLPNSPSVASMQSANGKASKTGTPVRPRSAPAGNRVISRSPSPSPATHSLKANNSRPTSAAINQTPEEKIRERNEAIKTKFLQYWKENIAILSSGESTSNAIPLLETCSFHALPRTVQHWRLLTMIHCFVFEDSSTIEDVVRHVARHASPTNRDHHQQHHHHHLHHLHPTNHNNLPTTINTNPSSSAPPPTSIPSTALTYHNHCLLYEFGQQQIFIPFNISSSTLQTDPRTQSYYLPIQECRIQHVLSKKDDLFDYLKKKLIKFYLFSYDEHRRAKIPKLVKKRSFNFEKSFEERKEERFTMLLQSQSSSRSLLLSSPPSSPKEGKNKPAAIAARGGAAAVPAVIMQECDFEVSLQEMKYYEKDSKVLSTGFAKFDVVLKLKTVHLSSVSIKISFAVQLDDELPGNINTVRSFTVEEQKLYWPSASYYPKQSCLPSTWLSMLLIPSSTFLTVARVEEEREKEMMEKEREREQQEQEMKQLESTGQIAGISPSSLRKMKGGEDRRKGRKSTVIVNTTLIQSIPSLRRSSQAVAALSALYQPAPAPSTSNHHFHHSFDLNDTPPVENEPILPSDRREKKSFRINKITDAISLKPQQFILPPKTAISKDKLDSSSSMVLTSAQVGSSSTFLPNNTSSDQPAAVSQDPLIIEKQQNRRIREFSSRYFGNINIDHTNSTKPKLSTDSHHENDNKKITNSSVVGRKSLILNQLYSAIDRDNQLSGSGAETGDNNNNNNNNSLQEEGKTHHPSSSQPSRLQSSRSTAQLLQQNEGFQRLIKFIEELFTKEEIEYQTTGIMAGEADQTQSHPGLREEEDDDDEYDDVLLLKSKFITDKLIMILKNIKADYFQHSIAVAASNNNNNNNNQDLTGTRPSSANRGTQLQRQRSAGTIILSPKPSSSNLRTTFSLRQSANMSTVSSVSSQSNNTTGQDSLLTFQSKSKINAFQEQRLAQIHEHGNDDDDDDAFVKDETVKEEEDDQEEEEDEDANSLDSDMNYISEDIMNSMIYTLQYILVIDFLPKRIKWMTFKSLIFEYSPMFFTNNSHQQQRNHISSHLTTTSSPGKKTYNPL